MSFPKYKTMCVVCTAANKDKGWEDKGEGFLRTFPKDEALKSVWLERLNIKGKLNSRARVCDKHFRKSQYAGRCRLKKGAVPTRVQVEPEPQIVKVETLNPDEAPQLIPIVPKPLVFNKNKNRLVLDKPTLILGNVSAVPLCPTTTVNSVTPSTSQTNQPISIAPQVLRLAPGILSPVVFQAPIGPMLVRPPVPQNEKLETLPLTFKVPIPAKKPRIPEGSKMGSSGSPQSVTVVKLEEDESGNDVVKTETEDDDGEEEQLCDNLDISYRLSGDVDPLS